MTEQAKQYQITCFLSPLLEQKNLDETIQKIKQWINEQGGSIPEDKTLPAKPIRKNLAYPIKKLREAFYLSLNFLLPAQTMSQFCEQLNLEKDIIRYLITVKEKPKSEPIKEPLDFKLIDKIEPLPIGTDRQQKQPDKTEIGLEKQKREKLKIEELDKKLEEILNT